MDEPVSVRLIDSDAVVFTELGVLRYDGFASPNRVFSNPHSGGLGQAMPAALGAQLADHPADSSSPAWATGPISSPTPRPATRSPKLCSCRSLPSHQEQRLVVQCALRRQSAYPGGVPAGSASMPLTSLEPAQLSEDRRSRQHMASGSRMAAICQQRSSVPSGSFLKSAAKFCSN
ncbi:MAG: hypothetical protein R3D62_03170 [Xanthobacteraceae bacterium]